MDLSRKFANYNKRWNIQINEKEQFSHFKNRVIYVIDESIGNFLAKNPNIDRDFYRQLSFLSGKKPVVKTSPLSIPSPSEILDNLSVSTFKGKRTERSFGDIFVYKKIESSENITHLTTTLQVLFWIFEEHDQKIHIQLAKKLRDISKLTPSVGFCAVIKKNSVVLYPPGANLLDEGVVNDTLSWLEDYPEAAKHFEKALAIYQAGDTERYRDLLDSLRLALEYLLRKVLNSDRSIENQIKETKSVLLPWLKQKGVHGQIAAMYQKLLAHYDSYQNDAVKHKEKFFLDDIEFMIYLTGTFMRMLLQLSVQR